MDATLMTSFAALAALQIAKVVVIAARKSRPKSKTKSAQKEQAKSDELNARDLRELERLGINANCVVSVKQK